MEQAQRTVLCESNGKKGATRRELTRHPSCCFSRKGNDLADLLGFCFPCCCCLRSPDPQGYPGAHPWWPVAQGLMKTKRVGGGRSIWYSTCSPDANSTVSAPKLCSAPLLPSALKSYPCNHLSMASAQALDKMSLLDMDPDPRKTGIP